ncbi:MAG: hemolysin family protein [Chitinophagales bacterium]
MEIFLILLSLSLIAFFSGIEIAFVSANKLRVELMKEKGSYRARIIADFNNNPSKFISTMLIGLNIALVTFGSVTSNYFTHEHFSFLPQGEIRLLLVQTVFTTFVILIFGELLPKILFRVNSDQSLLLFSYPIKLFYILLSPLTNIFHRMSRWIIRSVAGADLSEAKLQFTKEDLEYLVKETAVNEMDADGEADPLNTDIFEKALYLKDVKVRTCMIPRPEIQGVELSESMEELRKRFIESKLSRLVVYEEEIDNIVGYVHHFDMLKNPASLHSIVRPLPVIPTSMTARDLLLQFIRERKNMARVVDEYGGTAGLITLEDLMEQIFGEIRDEHDDEELTEKQVSEVEFILSGRLDIDYLNREYKLDIPEGDYTTLSGYVISGFEDIPEAGKVIEMDDFVIRVLRATDTRIELVNLKLKEKE